MPPAEIGWRLNKDNWGRGLASQGAEADFTSIFETLKLDKLASNHEPEDVASLIIMLRIGMNPVAIKLQA